MDADEIGQLPESINPYKILKVGKNFTYDELKSNYRRIAMQVHPDKGGSNELFQLVTLCFRKLSQELQLREEQRTYMELKQGYQRHAEKEQPIFQEPHATTAASSGRGSSRSKSDKKASATASAASFGPGMNNDKFNQMFEQFHLNSDPYKQTGYGNMMAEHSPIREDLSVPQTFRKGQSVSQETFNDAFNRQSVSSTNRQLMRYKAPEPMEMAKRIAFAELGVSKIDDFSGQNDTMKRLQYSDYMRAHSTSKLIDPALVQNKRPEFRTVEEYERYRAQNNQMTEEELREYALKQKQEEKREKLRQREQQRLDEMHSRHFAEIQRRMLDRF